MATSTQPERPTSSAGPSDHHVLRAEHLVKAYKGRRVVDGVDVEVAPREIVGLLGPNGAGKTTTFYMVVGLVQPNQGRVLLDGEDLSRLPMYQRARRGIGYLPQETSIFRKLTVEENLRLILEMQPLAPQEQNRRVNELLERLHIEAIRKQKAMVLSGGERRRAEIARALATEPKFMLLDEPFTGVDPKAVDDIQQIILQLKADGMGVLLTDHSVRETLAITDRAYIIHEGKILVSGTPDQLLQDETARRFYFGERFNL